jgi:hypothetical protein
MSKAAVKEILREIDALVDAERITLELELARRFERKWSVEAGKARKIAKVRKIDQKTIDRIIERKRYGT